MHKGTRRSETTKTIRETEAEAVAYVVCQSVGLDTSSRSADYIQLYQGDAGTLLESLEAIRSVATLMLSELETAATVVPETIQSGRPLPATCQESHAGQLSDQGELSC